MIENQITQAKQCALTTRDWDTYQIIVRTCLTPDKSPSSLLTAKTQTDGLVSAADSMLPAQKRG